MKILQMVTRRQYRGAEVFAANLSSELIGFGHDIIFAGLYKSLGEELKVEGALNIDLAEKQKGFLSPDLVKDLKRLIEIEGPDIIQCNGSDTLKYVIAASFFVPGRPVLYRNISMISKWVDTAPKMFLYKNIFKRVSHVSSVGKEAVEDFISTLNYPRERTSVIRRGIPIREVRDPEEIEKYREEFGIKPDEKLAIHVGNFSPEKNHVFLLDLFSEIKKVDSTIKLVCVGTGILFDYIKSEIERRQISDTVLLAGFRKDIPELLAASECFLLCSRVEGVPGVILEAGVQKKPSVSVDVGGVSEVLIDGTTGYLVKENDLDEFKEKLLFLMNNSRERERLGRNAYSLVRKEFDPKKKAIEFEDLYNRLIERQKSMHEISD